MAMHQEFKSFKLYTAPLYLLRIFCTEVYEAMRFHLFASTFSMAVLNSSNVKRQSPSASPLWMKSYGNIEITCRSGVWNSHNQHFCDATELQPTCVIKWPISHFLFNTHVFQIIARFITLVYWRQRPNCSGASFAM